MNNASIQKALAYLRGEIQSGTWAKKERLPPVRILARHAQVSAAAMCSALALLKEENVVSVIKNRGAYLGSSPASNSRTRSSTGWNGGQRWQRLKTQIEVAIFSGYYPPGEPLPSLHDLEKTYSVSYKTLHKALESIAEEGLIKPWKKTYSVPAVRKAHATLAFISVAGASSALSFGGYPHTEFLSALRREGEKSLIHISMCVYDPDRSAADFTGQLRALREKHPVMGYVLWTSRLPDRKLNLLVEILREETQLSHESGLEKPLAVIETGSDSLTSHFLRQSSEGKGPGFRIFSVAGLMAGRQVGQYLLKGGHRKVAFLSYFHKELSSQQRYRGLLQAYQDAGLAEGVIKLVVQDIDNPGQTPPSTSPVLEYMRQAETFLSASAEASRGHYASYALEQMQTSVANYIHQLKIVERVESMLNTILEQPDITACVGANDRMALMIRDHLTRKGVRVPRDISIVGFDDSKAATDKDLTSYSFVFPDIARKVLTYVLAPRARKLVRDDNFVECEGLLLERGSSGVARKEEIPSGVLT